MRICFILIYFCAICNVTYCQTKIITNKIDQIGNINKDANVNASIANIIVNVHDILQTQLFFIRGTQQLDTSGYYVTTIYVGNKDKLYYFGADLRFKFSNEVDSTWYKASVEVLGFEEGIRDDDTAYYFKGSQSNGTPDIPVMFVFSFKSKEQLSIDIRGLDGNSPPDIFH
jgi:hypothetical protein